MDGLRAATGLHRQGGDLLQPRLAAGEEARRWPGAASSARASSSDSGGGVQADEQGGLADLALPFSAVLFQATWPSFRSKVSSTGFFQ